MRLMSKFADAAMAKVEAVAVDLPETVFTLTGFTSTVTLSLPLYLI